MTPSVLEHELVADASDAAIRLKSMLRCSEEEGQEMQLECRDPNTPYVLVKKCITFGEGLDFPKKCSTSQTLRLGS